MREGRKRLAVKCALSKSRGVFIHHGGAEDAEDEEEVNRGTGEQEKEKNTEKIKDCKMKNTKCKM